MIYPNNSSTIDDDPSSNSTSREHHRAKSHQYHLFTEIVTSGLSASIAYAVTIPIEVIKVRIQLANAAMSTSKSAISAGPIEMARKMLRKEGIRAFYTGIWPGVFRGLFYGGVRLGAYGPIKELLKEMIDDDRPESLKLLRDIIAASLSGTIAAVISNPVDLCKTKLQVKNSPYRSSFHVIRDVIEKQGIRGLWVGTVPGAIRTATLTTTQCVTYDHAKRFCKHISDWDDGLKLHVSAGLVTGLVTTTATAPFDTIKTNMYAKGDHGVLEMTRKIFHKEGISGLLRGWSTAYVRLGPQTMVIFLVMEELRHYTGLAAL